MGFRICKLAFWIHRVYENYPEILIAWKIDAGPRGKKRAVIFPGSFDRRRCVNGDPTASREAEICPIRPPYDPWIMGIIAYATTCAWLGVCRGRCGEQRQAC